MKFNKDFSLRKILNNKKVVMAISIFLAFIFWLGIKMGETPTIDRTISKIPFTLETEGTVVGELGLDEISGITQQTVTVKLSGPAYILNQLTENDISVSASLSEVTKPGEYQLTLSANKKSFGSEYTIVSVTPSVITAKFDYIDTKQFTVTPKITGVTAVTGLEKGEPVVADVGSDTITIKGPRTEIQKISSVVASASANEVLSETKTYDGTIILYDENSNELNRDNYTISATTVKISQPILKSKTVPIKATFLNVPAAYTSSPIDSTLSVTEVNIAGPAETIDTITAVELSPIDFNEISKSKNSFDVTLILPNGVKTVDKIEKVNVKINTNGFAEKSFTVSKIVTTGNTLNFTVSLKSSVKNVKMCGPSNAIYSLKADDLYAVVDLTDKNGGDYIVTVTVKSDKYPNIWQVGTYQATIKVE